MPFPTAFIESYCLKDIWVSESRSAFIPFENQSRPIRAKIPNERIYEKIVESSTGLTSYQISCDLTKRDELNNGTTRRSRFIPGYQGFIPINTHNPGVKKYAEKL